MSQKSRVAYIDIYRGIAILLMVMGHVDFGKEFDHYIHAFHMPMWFFISGFFFKDKGNRVSEFLKIKAKKIFVPYVIFGLFHYLLAVLFIDSSRGLFHEEYIKTYLLTNYAGFPITGIFWFLTCIFIVEFIFLYVRRCVKSEVELAFTMLVLSLFGILWSKYSPVRMPWTADTALVALFFYYCGYIVKNNKYMYRWYSKALERGTRSNILLFTQTSHIKNGICTLKNQYFSSQNSNYTALCPYIRASCMYFGRR